VARHYSAAAESLGLLPLHPAKTGEDLLVSPCVHDFKDSNSYASIFLAALGPLFSRSLDMRLRRVCGMKVLQLLAQPLPERRVSLDCPTSFSAVVVDLSVLSGRGAESLDSCRKSQQPPRQASVRGWRLSSPKRRRLAWSSIPDETRVHLILLSLLLGEQWLDSVLGKPFHPYVQDRHKGAYSSS
jgi:hypothetical protein